MPDDRDNNAYVTHGEFESFAEQVFKRLDKLDHKIETGRVRTLDYIPLVSLLVVIAGAVLYPIFTKNGEQDSILQDLTNASLVNAQVQGRFLENQRQQRLWHEDLAEETHEQFIFLRDRIEAVEREMMGDTLDARVTMLEDLVEKIDMQGSRRWVGTIAD